MSEVVILDIYIIDDRVEEIQKVKNIFSNDKLKNLGCNFNFRYRKDENIVMAVEELVTNKPDIVILDLELEGGDHLLTKSVAKTLVENESCFFITSNKPPVIADPIIKRLIAVSKSFMKGYIDKEDYSKWQLIDLEKVLKEILDEKKRRLELMNLEINIAKIRIDYELAKSEDKSNSFCVEYIKDKLTINIMNELIFCGPYAHWKDALMWELFEIPVSLNKAKKLKNRPLKDALRNAIRDSISYKCLFFAIRNPELKEEIQAAIKKESVKKKDNKECYIFLYYNRLGNVDFADKYEGILKTDKYTTPQTKFCYHIKPEYLEIDKQNNADMKSRSSLSKAFRDLFIKL